MPDRFYFSIFINEHVQSSDFIMRSCSRNESAIIFLYYLPKLTPSFRTVNKITKLSKCEKRIKTKFYVSFFDWIWFRSKIAKKINLVSMMKFLVDIQNWLVKSIFVLFIFVYVAFNGAFILKILIGTKFLQNFFLIISCHKLVYLISDWYLWRKAPKNQEKSKRNLNFNYNSTIHYFRRILKYSVNITT